MSLMLLQSGKSYASESYAASQSSVCGSYGILRRFAMTDSLVARVSDIQSRSPQAPCCHTAMPVEFGYARKTQSLIHELREEYDERWWDVTHTEGIWKKREIPNPEQGRQLAEIYKDIRERLETLVGFDIDPDPLSGGLDRAFDNTLTGYRAPSRSRSRSPSRWQHPTKNGEDLEAS